MEVQTDGLAKRFATQWVFRDLNLHIDSGTAVAVTGPNGSGKSTLLKIIAGALPPTMGKITYRLNDKEIAADRIYRHVSFAAPYAEMIEELTLFESWKFHGQFRTWLPQVDGFQEFSEAMSYRFNAETPINAMSSGMKQRIRLAFALFSVSDLLILDEPTSNLDVDGVRWFHEALSRFAPGKSVLIASNVQEDLRGCQGEVRMGSA
jgi:ABC-type multidrug transport system ATPase subunit